MRYLLHHTTAVRRQSVEGVRDVPHVLVAPQPLCHRTGTRPRSGKSIRCHVMCQGSKYIYFLTLSLWCHMSHTVPESGCQVGGVHILSPQTGFSAKHKLLLCFSSCLQMKSLMRSAQLIGHIPCDRLYKMVGVIESLLLYMVKY